MLKYNKSNHGRVRAGAWSQDWKLYIILATEELFANIEIFRDYYTSEILCIDYIFFQNSDEMIT